MSQQQCNTHSARAKAGHEVLHILESNGLEAGGEILREYLRAFFLGHAAVAGWGETLNLVQQLSHNHFVSIRREEKLHLVATERVA